MKIVVKESYPGELEKADVSEKIQRAVDIVVQKHTCGSHEVLEKGVKAHHDHRIDAVDEMVALMKKAYERRAKMMVDDIAKRIRDGE